MSKNQAPLAQPVAAETGPSSAGGATIPAHERLVVAPPRRKRRAAATVRIRATTAVDVPAHRDDAADRLEKALDAVLETRLDGEGRLSVGAALAALWADIDNAIRPYVGAAGVAALFEHSLRAAARGHAWLAELAAPGAAANASRPSSAFLSQVFDARERREASAAGIALGRAFCRVLSGAVGAALAERLLDPVAGASTNRNASRIAATMSM